MRSPSAISSTPGEARRSVGRGVQLAYRLEVNEYNGRAVRAAQLRACAPRLNPVLRFAVMELNQLKRFIKDLEERTNSLRGYL